MLLAGAFLRAYWRRVLAISVLLLIPCFWHRHIEAGDLASHVYNAWLATLVEHGQAPGLYLANQWNNVACDVALARLGDLVGFAAAEKIVVPVCVLIFFWGAFALASAAAQRAPWFLVPCFAMLAYGYSFNMGFLNYCLSLGFAFFAVAMAWRGKKRELLLGLAPLALALFAHPIGFLWSVGATAYIRLSQWLPRQWRLLMPVTAAIALLGVHRILRLKATVDWLQQPVWQFNGADQLALYGERYLVLAWIAFFLGLGCFLAGLVSRDRKTLACSDLRLAAELYLVAFLTVAFLPQNVRIPSLYAGWIGLLVSRLTTISAALGLCVLACVQPKRWHLAAFTACALVFFAFLYQDTGVLNKMEDRAERLVSGLPSGRRLLVTIWAPPESRIEFISHIVDRACILRCFDYGNYEPSSGQFRVRARIGNPIVTASADDSQAMESGEYEVQEENLPMLQIYQCDAKDLTQLCSRELSAGELNGRLGYHPAGKADSQD